MILVQLAGLEQVQQRLVALQQRGHQMRPVFQAIGEYLNDAHRQRFDREQAPDGSHWQANSPRTRKYSVPKVLHGKTLNLRDGMVIEARSTLLRFGPGQATSDYAAIHQFGGLAGRGHRLQLPARPYLGVSEQDRHTILAMLSGFLAGS